MADIERKQRNFVGRLGDTDDRDVAALIHEELNALATQKRQFEAERALLQDQRAAWSLAQDRLQDLDAWRRRVAANLGGITYEERRLALRALGVEVRVWRTDHDPRFDITMRLDFIDSTTRGCMHNLPASASLCAGPTATQTRHSRSLRTERYYTHGTRPAPL